MLDVVGLAHSFSRGSSTGRLALDIAELSIVAGQLTTITGPSGSGKTTLLYVLSGLLRASAGQLRWDGLDIAALSEGERDRWRRRNAGFVFQNFNLIDEMTALQNVTVAANFSAFSDAGVRGRARDLLRTFGVADEKRRVATYSRGEQQRVAMARALIFDPPIVFADEPTASLDEANAQGLATQFRALAAEGKTVVAVSHDRILIEGADRVIRLDHGCIVAPETAA